VPHWIAAAVMLVANIGLLLKGPGWVFAFIGLPLAVVIYTIFHRLSTRYIITNRNLYHTHGILTSDDREIPIAGIREIRLKQNIIHRIFGIGQLSFSTAASSKVELEFSGISNPKEVRQLVRQQAERLG
jgi:putative membrane protein